jgi:hypothetical protein
VILLLTLAKKTSHCCAAMNYQNKEEWVNIAKRILPAKIYETWELREIQGMSFPDMEIKLDEDKLRLYFRHKKAQAEVMIWVNDPKRITLDTLSMLSRNALANYGIKTKKQAMKAYNDAELHPSRMRNYGWKSHQEVCEWLGVPMVKENPEKKEFAAIDRIMARLQRRLQVADEETLHEVNDEIKTLERWTRIIKSKYSK